MGDNVNNKFCDITVVDTNKAEWEIFPVPFINAKLEHNMLLNDAETGVMILKMVYRAGKSAVCLAMVKLTELITSSRVQERLAPSLHCLYSFPS